MTKGADNEGLIVLFPFKLFTFHQVLLWYLIVIFELVKRILAAAVVSSLNIFKFYFR